MFEYKLQLGCLLIVIYYIVIYIRETTENKSVGCNRLFDYLLAFCPWAIVLDGVTAWTVNHLEIVPMELNLILHCLFMLFEIILLIISFLYMVDITIGFRNKHIMFLCMLPGIVTIAIILAFVNQLYFVEGERTNYSMGVSAIVCFLSMVIHYLLLIIMLVKYRRLVERRKLISVLSCIIISFVLLGIEIIFPESLISALLPTISLICLYENFEDPYLKRLQIYNEEMVTSFATLVESRDNSTGGHIKRTKSYVSIIINEMKKLPEYKDILSKDYVRDVLNAAPMHDIGKIATPDSILQKPGKLTEEEYEIMKSHASDGGEIIKKTFEDINDPEYLRIAYEVARFHHEKWNGKGYPNGLMREEIPLHSRIMAIADVFDAVSAKRCYRDALPLDVCFKIIEEGAGTDFDPKLVRLFLDAKDKVILCYRRSS